ncbi:MAG: hypothetical protein CMA71_02360 [Euryarchaeota archaeon]|nr:hypothetical protein [Euryarchaeota archaeon]
MRKWLTTLVLSSLMVASVSSMVTAQISQPDIVQEHWYHSYATLTLDINAWEDDHPEIVNLSSIGQTELGREIWMLQITDESCPLDWDFDGCEHSYYGGEGREGPLVVRKEVVYIDGGHHGNEHLGTELAFLVAEYYIEGWGNGDQEIIDLLATTELHILIMLNADGNDFDTRWNVNQVDLNRNYDHYWNTCPTTQPGSSAFSESETLANSIYMNDVVPHADLYITMHTGVWIMLYPWGKWPEQPSDWEMYHHIRDEVNSNISDIPIRNANQGLYPNCGTSRDYGYGVMGYPTFTFETDDEQFLLGTVEALSERLGEELDVMNYLIENVWYWRARLVADSLKVEEGKVHLSVSNLGYSSTSNATLLYMEGVDSTEIWLPGSDEPVEMIGLTQKGGTPQIQFGSDFNFSTSGFGFAVNATNSTITTLDFTGAPVSSKGIWTLYYQKRVVDSSMWVGNPINDSVVDYESSGGSSLLPTPSILLILVSFTLASINGRNGRFEQ